MVDHFERGFPGLLGGLGGRVYRLIGDPLGGQPFLDRLDGLAEVGPRVLDVGHERLGLVLIGRVPGARLCALDPLTGEGPEGTGNPDVVILPALAHRICSFAHAPSSLSVSMVRRGTRSACFSVARAR